MSDATAADTRPRRPDQVLRTTSRAPRLAPLPRPKAEPPRRSEDRTWVLITTTTALILGWLALSSSRPTEIWPHGLAYLACLLIASTPLFVPGRARGPTFLVASIAAALMPVLAIVVDLVGVARPAPSVMLAATIAAVLAALAAAMAVKPVAPPPTPDREDRPIGRYRLVRKLGAGGMGEVWRAEHDTLARPAALKLIRRHRLEDPNLEGEILERFRKEAEVTARLLSPHTVELYDFGVTDDGALYYAMELLEGMSVHALVDRYGPQPEARVAFLLRHACHSLIEAHDAGLVHRDLKPENLFVAHRGRDEDFLKVLDFGLVKELDSAPTDPRERRPRMHLTIAGARPGTPGFMAPEQIVGNAPIDQRADVYALGCVAYYLLTASPVFQGKVAAQLLFAHVDTEPDPPSARLGRPLHPGLEALVLRCLQKSPAARPTTEELDDALAALVFVPPWSQARARAWWASAVPLTKAD